MSWTEKILRKFSENLELLYSIEKSREKVPMVLLVLLLLNCNKKYDLISNHSMPCMLHAYSSMRLPLCWCSSITVVL